MDNKDEYYASLSGITQKANWKNWQLFMLKAIEVTANLTYYKINDIIQAKDAILEAIVLQGNINRPESQVNTLFTEPFTRVKHLTDRDYMQKKRLVNTWMN